jgi:hypothetical protein
MASATPGPTGGVDFGRCFSFVTEDPEWLKKVLIGGVFVLLSVLLVGIPFVLGYFGRTLRNVAQGVARPLPTWDDLGELFGEGLRLAAVYLVYGLAMAVVMGVIGAILLLPFIAMAGGRLEHDQSAAFGALGGLGLVGFYGLVMLASLALAVYLPAALVRAAMRGTVADGFAWREIFAFIRANLGNYFLSLVIYLLASFVAQFGVILCCVGLFPAAFWSYLVLAAGLGQTVRLNPTSV